MKKCVEQFLFFPEVEEEGDTWDWARRAGPDDGAP